MSRLVCSTDHARKLVGVIVGGMTSKIPSVNAPLKSLTLSPISFFLFQKARATYSFIVQIRFLKSFRTRKARLHVFGQAHSLTPYTPAQFPLLGLVVLYRGRHLTALIQCLNPSKFGVLFRFGFSDSKNLHLNAKVHGLRAIWLRCFGGFVKIQ